MNDILPLCSFWSGSYACKSKKVSNHRHLPFIITIFVNISLPQFLIVNKVRHPSIVSVVYLFYLRGPRAKEMKVTENCEFWEHAKPSVDFGWQTILTIRQWDISCAAVNVTAKSSTALWMLSEGLLHQSDNNGRAAVGWGVRIEVAKHPCSNLRQSNSLCRCFVKTLPFSSSYICECNLVLTQLQIRISRDKPRAFAPNVASYKLQVVVLSIWPLVTRQISSL